MIRLLRDVRLIPIVLFAAVCLFTLKILGIAFGGGYLFGDLAGRKPDGTDVTASIPSAQRADALALEAARVPEPAKQSWAQQMFGYPDATASVGGGSPPPKQAAAADKGNRADAKPGEGTNAATGWRQVAVDNERPLSAAERAILERLSDRRLELEARARELDTRENLLKAAEKRLESRVNELKALEARVNDAVQNKDENEIARFKNLITMYENMKAKDAAKIFDRLEMKVLLDVTTQINPRRMSDILGQMTPESAERLTVELAARAAAKDKLQPSELPKIEGRPNPN